MPDSDADTCFRMAEHARFRRVVDEGVVVVQSSAEVVVVDEVGVSVLERLDRPTSVGQLIDDLLTEYAVDRDRLAADIAAYLPELEQAGVVQRVLCEGA